MSDSNLDLKPVLHAMLSGWCDKNNEDLTVVNGVVVPTGKEPPDWFKPYCDGDERAAFCLHLFSYWSNDIISVAADYGITTEYIDGKFQVIDVPERPSPEHWWHAGEWNWKVPEDKTAVEGDMVWEKGYWHEPLEDKGEEVFITHA